MTSRTDGRMRAVAALVAAAGVCLAGPALAQYGTQPNKQTPPTKTNPPPAKSNQPAPATTQPAQSGAKKEAPKEGPYVTRSQTKDLTLTITVDVKTDRSTDLDQNKMPIIKSMEFKTLAFVFPLIGDTGSSKVASVFAKASGKEPTEDAPLSMVHGELKLDDKVVTKAPTILEKGYPSDVRLGRWDAADATVREVSLTLSIPAHCSKTTLDEKTAVKVGWPTGEWPKAAALTFKPQMYITEDMRGPYDMTGIKEAVKGWTKGNPKSAPPLMVAKAITKEVMERIQPSGNGLTFTRNGEIEGFGLVGAADTLKIGRGSEFDMTCVLAACLREAGLPARTVIGYAREGTGGNNFLDKKKDNAEMRSWVEFCLYDEPNNTINWVPIDIARMRKKSSRATALDRPWQYFGTHDELNEIVPFAFQFHPPTTVLAYGSPGFWGWLVTPQPPAQAFQALRFDIAASSQTADKNKNKDKKDEKNDRKTK